MLSAPLLQPAALHRALGATWQLCQLRTRGLAVPAEQGAGACVGEAVALDDAAGPTALLSLSDRPWGPAASLRVDVVKDLLGPTPPPRVSVLRHAFLPHDAPQLPLAEVVRVLAPRAAAVTSAAAQAEQRVLVDSYELAGERYVLRTSSQDLLRHCRQAGVAVTLVPAPTQYDQPPRADGQSTNEVLMVAPSAFGFNEQAAADNSFMHAPGGDSGALARTVLREFSALHHALTEQAGVKVSLFAHSSAHGTPDAVFPNNWFSTHAAAEAGGNTRSSTLVLYPMKCPNRARERRGDVLDFLRHRGYQRHLDLGAGGGSAGPQERHLEGTGALVLDRVRGVAYVALSERADAGLAAEWAAQLGYRELVTFHSHDSRGAPVYHTNVMMAVGTSVAVVCAESVRDDKERAHLLGRLRAHHEVVDITCAQMDALCGNVLELQDGRGLPVLALSQRAFDAFTPEQRTTLRRHVADLVAAPIPTLEDVGGGGVRCTLAELF